MNILLRLETPADYRAVEELTREAFWGHSRPTCDEHYLVHLLRNSPAFIPELDFVAEVDGILVGHIIYSKAKILSKNGINTEVLNFGPLSVLPEYQRKGIGAALMRHSIVEAQRLGYRAIVFYGHPDYYPRFGFRNAAAFGITTKDSTNFDALMAMPLYDGALDGVSGAFHEDPAFRACEDYHAYDQHFPHKEPVSLTPIDVLLERLNPAAQRAFTDRGIKILWKLQEKSGREILQWEGIDREAVDIINEVLSEYGGSERLFPSSYILQLSEMGLRVPIVSKIRSKDGVHVFRVESEGQKYILKTFDNPEHTREISNYQLLSDLGIPTLPMLRHTESALLLPDVEASAEYRLGQEQDMSDPQTARAIASWYKTLHNVGRVYMQTNYVTLYDETDVITPDNMDFVASKTNTQDNPLWKSISDNFDILRQKIDALPRTFTYNDFYRTNLVVAVDGKSAMMLDFNLLGKGYIYGDIRNVTSNFSNEAAKAFVDEYGEVEGLDEREKVADAILAPLVNLFFACKREAFPSWANSSLDELRSGILLDHLKKWIKCEVNDND